MKLLEEPKNSPDPVAQSWQLGAVLYAERVPLGFPRYNASRVHAFAWPIFKSMLIMLTLSSL